MTTKNVRVLLLCIASACVAINVAVNATNNTPQGLEGARNARIQKLCPVNDLYCS